MYDRWDSNKGRYVTYDYQPKGDRFSRGLTVRPRAYTTISNYNTGHSAIRGVCTNRTQHLTVGAIKEMFPEEIVSKLEAESSVFIEPAYTPATRSTRALERMLKALERGHMPQLPEYANMPQVIARDLLSRDDASPEAMEMAQRYLLPGR